MRTTIEVVLITTLMAGCGAIDVEEVMAPREPLGGTLSADLTGEATYAGTVQPLLIEYCSLCHNPSSPTGGLDATSYSGLVEMTDVVFPGEPDLSLLIQLIEGGVMPPPGNPGPSDEEIAAVRVWVEAGAENN